MRSLVAAVAVTSLSSCGPRAGTLASNSVIGGSSGLAAVVTSLIFSVRSPISASEWLTTANLMLSLPGAVSVMRYPDSSRYLASGCGFVMTVSVAWGVPACFTWEGSGAGAEHPVRSQVQAAKLIATAANLTVSNVTRCLAHDAARTVIIV